MKVHEKDRGQRYGNTSLMQLTCVFLYGQTQRHTQTTYAAIKTRLRCEPLSCLKRGSNCTCGAFDITCAINPTQERKREATCTTDVQNYRRNAPVFKVLVYNSKVSLSLTLKLLKQPPTVPAQRNNWRSSPTARCRFIISLDFNNKSMP